METKTKVGYIESVELFADTMKERFVSKDSNLSLVILAGNEEGVQLISYGDKHGKLLSMASTIATEDGFKKLILAALSLATIGGDLKEIIEKFKPDDAD
jgi:hypothetical protein